MNQILSEKSTEIPYVYIFMKHYLFLQSSFYANLATRVSIKQIAQFDSSEYHLKDHTQPKYEISTMFNQKVGKVWFKGQMSNECIETVVFIPGNVKLKYYLQSPLKYLMFTYS